MSRPQEIAYVEGCGNVFADLGLEDAEEHFARAQIQRHLRSHCLS